MEKLTGLVDRITHEMDKLAGFCITVVMILVVCNIFLRQVFSRPILGTYELVGYLTALGVSLALARCAYLNGHIAVDYIANKFPKKMQLATDSIINLAALCFWAFTAWHLGVYAQDLMAKGVVSPTAQIPIYPVVMLIGLSMLGLCLVSLLRVAESCRSILTAITSTKLSCQYEGVENIRKAVR